MYAVASYADPESYVTGGLTVKTVFTLVDEGKEDPKTN